MREIVSPLSGIRSPISRVDPYKAAGFRPTLVADMTRDYFRNTSRKTFDDLFTHSRLGNATMVDSDGLIKWAPHNLVLNSATPATQSITVVNGADYTVECTGSGSITLSGAGTGTVTEGSPVEITASTTSLTLTVAGSVDLMWCYRSDLGGMAPVPLDARVAGSETYVPTTSTAKYLPRRHNHTYNGSAWVDAGTLIETEARTNLITNSLLSGATVGVVGSGGALPTGWSGVLFDTVEIMSIDTYMGAPRIRIKATLDNSGGGSPVYPRIEIASFTIVASTAYTYTVWGKDGPDKSITTTNLLVPDGVSNFLRTDFDGASEMTQFTASATSDASATGTQTVRIAHTVAAGEVGVSDFYLSMPQFESASTPSSYIPTSGSTVTRAADTNGLTIGSSVAPWGSAVCIQMKGRTTGDSYTTLRWYTDANNYITQEIGASDFTFEQAASGTVDSVTGGSITSGINVPFNIASRHGSTFINGAVDGTALTENTTPTALPDLSGSDLQIGYDFMGNIEEVRVWVADIGDTGIAEASA